MGISEYLVVDQIHFADVHGGTGMYVFPAFAQLGDFVQERIDPPLQASYYFSQICGMSNIPMKDRLFVGGTHKVSLKRVRNGHVYFRGASRSHLLSVAVDQMTLDEIDAIEAIQPKAESWATERLGHSNFKWMRFASIPTYDDVGIDAKWQMGTQHEWHIKCDHCGTWQFLEWDKNVVVTGADSPDTVSAQVVCEKCRRPVNRLEYEPGWCEWVPRYPDREMKSYHISKLYSSRVTMDYLARASINHRPGQQQLFYNSHLGEVYRPAGDYVSDDMINDSIGNHRLSTGCKADILAIDPGYYHHWVAARIVDGAEKVVALGYEEKWSDLGKLVKRYQPRVLAIDSGYEETKCQELAKEYPNIVTLVAWKGDKHEAIKKPYLRKAKPHDKTEIRYVDVDRDKVYQAVIDRFAARSGLVVLPAEVRGMKGGDPLGDFYKQMQGVKRVKKVDPITEDISIEYIKTSMAHWFDGHALLEVALDLWRPGSGIRMEAGTWGGRQRD